MRLLSPQHWAQQAQDHTPKNLYGARNTGLIFHEYLKQRLLFKLGFVQSKIDEGGFYRGKMMFLIYVDDGILIHPDSTEIGKV